MPFLAGYIFIVIYRIIPASIFFHEHVNFLLLLSTRRGKFYYTRAHYSIVFSDYANFYLLRCREPYLVRESPADFDSWGGKK